MEDQTACRCGQGSTLDGQVRVTGVKGGSGWGEVGSSYSDLGKT